MSYEEYLEKSKNFIKKSTPWQRSLAILAIATVLAAVVVVINPTEKLLEMRNAQRRSDVVNILNSVYAYSVDYGSALPESITTLPTMICKSDAVSCDGLVDISEIIGKEKYLLSAVPVDPREKDINSSGYQIFRLASGRISVAAPLAENGVVISLSK